MARVARWSFVLWVAGVAAASLPARAAVTGEDVERAIRDGVRYLRNTQQEDGSWPGESGATELATLALLTAGEPADDPQIGRAIEFIRRHHDPASFVDPHKTYTIGLQTMVFAAIDPLAYRHQIARNAEWLIATQLVSVNPGGLAHGGIPLGSWSYGREWGRVARNRTGRGDNSNTQYALLGLNAAGEAGVPIPAQVWLAARHHWEACQAPDGGWSYMAAQRKATPSMTTAGVSSLVITGARLSRGREALVGHTIHDCGHVEADIPLQRGIDWLGSNFTVKGNLYYLYGLERAGRLTGLRFFGDHDWYREGAEELVQTQRRGVGAWNEGYGPLVSTSFALLFLAKGRAPVLVHKLRHGPGDDWNNDPDDVRNLVGLVSRDWKHLMTWQVVEPGSAGVAGMLQAPIAFLNGHEAPGLGPEAEARLRDYVEQGGFLFAESCCGRPEFDRGFRALMKRLFPAPESALHPLPEEHPVWRSRWPLRPADHRLEGIDFGCRTVVIYSPGDLSCWWNQMEDHRDHPAVIVAEKVGQNVVDYATGHELPADKLTIREARDFRADSPRRGALYIAKLRHSGDWNIAPLAIPNLTTILKEKRGFDVVINHKELSPRDPNLVHYPLIYVHGRAAPTFDREDLDHLRSHLDPGGGRSSPTPPAAAPPSTPPSASSSPSWSPGTRSSRSPATTSSTPRGPATTSRGSGATRPPTAGSAILSSKGSRSTAAGPSSTRGSTSAAPCSAPPPSTARGTPPRAPRGSRPTSSSTRPCPDTDPPQESRNSRSSRVRFWIRRLSALRMASARSRFFCWSSRIFSSTVSRQIRR